MHYCMVILCGARDGGMDLCRITSTVPRVMMFRSHTPGWAARMVQIPVNRQGLDMLFYLKWTTSHPYTVCAAEGQHQPLKWSIYHAIIPHQPCAPRNIIENRAHRLDIP